MNPDNIDFEKLKEEKEMLEIKENMAIKKALNSEDPTAFYKAKNYLEKKEKLNDGDTTAKAILVDPHDLSSSFGYKDKPFAVSYNVLRAMAKTPIIKAIIKTRKDQVSSFCQPQTNKYSTGFIIKKRESLISQKKQKKLSKAEENDIEFITKFILNCGINQNTWHADTFETFIKKIVEDSLTLDQATFEVVRNRKGELIEFYATDSSTMRIADTYDDNDYTKTTKVVNGYTPSYVQVIDSKPVAEFYPWELCFGIRNPSTELSLNGYGKSELEDMIQTVTSLLNSDFYNANFFKVGSAPKGILTYSGSLNETSLQDFRRQWVAQTSGVLNMHKLPMMNADKMNFVNLQQSNKDMEFSKYQEFLIKIACAIYTIDPAEIGFSMGGSSDSKPMFEGNNEAKLKYSKDKGLKPLLKSVQHWLNKYIIWQINPDFEFIFVGIQDEVTFEQDLNYDILMGNNFMTINEIREKRNLPPLPDADGDIINNPTYLQNKMAAMMNSQGGGDGGGQDQQDDEQNYDDNNNSESEDKGNEDDQNPFLKSLNEEIKRTFFNG